MPGRKRSALAYIRPRQRRLRAKERSRLQMPVDLPQEVNLALPQRPVHEEMIPEVTLPKGLCYEPDNFRPEFSIGTLKANCLHCAAYKFPGETPAMCCSNGKVDLQPLPALPSPLNELFGGETVNSKHFLENIRKYNAVFQLTSLGCKEANPRGWNPQFRIQGQLYHLIGSLQPDIENPPSFMQIYFLNDDDQVARRQSIVDGLLRPVLLDIQECLKEHHKYAKEIRCAYEFAASQDLQDFAILITESARPTGTHPGRYNKPDFKEVAVLMPNEPSGHRDILLRLRDNGLRRISELHRAYDSLQYPLLMPFATDGWNLDLKMTSRYKITQNQFYCFHFFTRLGNYLLQARKLFQLYLVDAYAKIESERLQFLRREQNRLRADNYQNLKDTVVVRDGDPTNVGQQVILPATYCGGPRYMFEKQQDAMAYVRKYGCPDMFITVTTNPNWKEITDHLLEGQHPHDRPDLLVRVFRLKLKQTMRALKDGCLGSVDAWLYNIEFQKRGLPHAHILLWLSRASKIHPCMIDAAVSAEIPDKNQDPELFTIVTSHMVHGPCGALNPNAPCMKDGICSKQFPKPFVQSTEIGTDSYPKYQRRDVQGGGKYAVKKVGGKEYTIDNSWIVPYNPWLLRQLNCHANVEVCTSIKSIKYVLKYVHKGADQATFQIQEGGRVDEISNFLNARYIGSTEAAWRIFEMPITERFPPVVHLQVHLENFQRVYFKESTAQQVAYTAPPATTLTSFFHLCATDVFAHNVLYADIPKYYTWDASKKTWQKRKRGREVEVGVYESAAIGRIYTISPKQGDCFYLRLLLLSVPGPTSFEVLRTVNGITHETYRDACLALGLLEDDNIHRLTLQEACINQTPQQLRNLFAIILTQICPSNPTELWEEFRQEMSEDYAYQADVTVEAAQNMALINLEDLIASVDGTTLEIHRLPVPTRLPNERKDKEYSREKNYSCEDQQRIADANIQQLTPEQSAIFNDLTQKIQSGQSGLCFLDAPGGCGKTFLIETILASQRAKSNIAIATASTGLAATLLPGGRTVHSTFKVPLSVINAETPSCSIKKGTTLSRVLQDASVLIIDEATLLHRKVIEAIDTTLRDIRSSSEVMGGLLTLLCGDFRQILPVIRQGTRANIVDACLKSSPLWRSVQPYRLTRNMRVALQADERAEMFANKLLKLGNGETDIVQSPDYVSLLNFGTPAENTDILLDRIYPQIHTNYEHHTWLMQRAILAPHNDSVSQINKLLAEKIPTQTHTYTAVNSVVDEELAVQFPVEFLNSIEVSGLPPHVLDLKCGMPVMLLRSIKPPELMNGTRCIVHKCYRHTVEVVIAVGIYSGQQHSIPRIPLRPSDTMFPFQFERKQFPLRPCFAMTINKAQGQTLKVIGLDLRQPIFAHGMLYVALSRTGKEDSITTLSTQRLAKNVVYTEVLQ